ncbi:MULTISPECIES: SLC45 family MFS transporter [Pseudothermotoga]|uniref:Major facilitator superfamily MFS_1 n=1 Tax=Pseudothermotoga lettingae (strain ATCC BAA-301 / DSM 14385 / NBRC 107922 / TMO) TaxID=416591 RepID=A8F673_PSELT|nr:MULTISPECIES: SLC45 family MFS transporter [Pseudothermotoga]ABV33657.1 major facilitator superfamily MFS_1 [Pseudothermotoga lettingae TMO]GLI49426.1 MFS transporter [Pseudothermotoga lettingae TMO]
MRFKYWKIFLLGFGFFGISVLWPLYNAYVPIFLKDFALPSFAVGIVMTIDNILAIIMLPYIGTLSDQTRTKLGRRKPYILIGAPAGALFFALIPVARNLKSLLLMMIIIIVMNISMALFRSPLIALMPDVTPSKYRSQANGIVNFMGGFGALLAYFAGKPLYDKNYAYPFFAGAIIMLIANILVLLFIRESSEYTIKSQENSKLFEIVRKGNRELFDNLRDVFRAKEKSLFFILVSILLWFIGFNALETFFTSYAKFHLNISESTGALILGVFSLTFMLFSIPAGWIGSKFGRKRTISIGLLILMICLTIIAVLSKLITDGMIINIFFVMFSISGIGWALINVNSLPMVVDMTRSEKAGGYTGLYYFFSMAANIFAPPLAGGFIDIAGYESLLFFSLIFIICSFITMRFVKRGEIVS